MKKVKCINNDDYKNYLTIGKVYEILNEDNTHYYLFNDNDCNNYVGYLKYRFLTDEEITRPTNPTHYQTKIQPIEFIEANNLGFHEGNVIKYITRYKYKNGIEDLEKAKTYIEMLIDKIKRESETDNNS